MNAFCESRSNIAKKTMKLEEWVRMLYMIRRPCDLRTSTKYSRVVVGAKCCWFILTPVCLLFHILRRNSLDIINSFFMFRLHMLIVRRTLARFIRLLRRCRIWCGRDCIWFCLRYFLPLYYFLLRFRDVARSGAFFRTPIGALSTARVDPWSFELDFLKFLWVVSHLHFSYFHAGGFLAVVCRDRILKCFIVFFPRKFCIIQPLFLSFLLLFFFHDP